MAVQSIGPDPGLLKKNWSAIFEYAPEAFHILDSSGNVLAANRKFYQFLGYDPGSRELINVRQWDAQCTPLKIAACLVEPPGSSSSYETIYRRRDGSLFPVEVCITTLPSANGSYLLCAAANVSDRLHPEEVQREGEERFLNIFHSNPEAISISSLTSGLVIDVNTAFCTQFGLSYEQVLGRNARELGLWVDPQEHDRMISLVRVKGQIKEFETRFRTTTGATGDMLVSARIITLTGEPCIMFFGRDITERRHIERALLEQTDFLTQVINNMGQGLIVTDGDGQLERFNPAYARLGGYDPGQLFQKAHHDPNLRKELANLQQASKQLNRGETTTYESRMVRADGSLAPVLVTGSPRVKDGHFAGSIAVVTDLTEIRRVEDALRESERFYRSLFENMDSFAYCRMLFDEGKPRDFIYLIVNKAFELQTGLKDVIGKKVSELVPGIREADPQLFEIYGRVAMTGQPERFEMFVEAMQMWFSVSMYCPAPEHFVAVFSVITERKKAENALRASEQQYHDMFDKNTAVKLLIDPLTGAIVKANQAAVRFYGWPVERLETMNINEINCLPPEQVRAEMELAASQKRTHFFFRHRLADGAIRDVEVHSSPLEVDGRKILFSIIHDISDRKKAEEELRASNAALEKTSRTRDELMATMSNALSTPLAGILGLSKSLQDKIYGELNEKQMAALQNIEKSGRRLQDLINKMLDIS